MQYTLGFHQTELFPEASTDGAPLFAQETTPALTRAYSRVQTAAKVLLTLPDDVSDTAYDAAIEERKQAYTEWHKVRGY